MELTIKTSSDLWLTRQKATLSELADSEKASIPAQTELSIVQLTIDEDYLQLTLREPLNGQTQWYVKALGTINLSMKKGGPTTPPTKPDRFAPKDKGHETTPPPPPPPSSQEKKGHDTTT